MDAYRYAFSFALGALAALALTRPGPALADVVYGTIKVKGELLASETVVVHVGQRQVPVQTDSNGHYRVVLPEGTYAVEYRGKQREIRSYSQPVKQDINLE